MADIYNDTLSSGANTGELTVTSLAILGVRCEGPILIEVKHGSQWNKLGSLGYSDSGVFWPPGVTIRVTNKAGADNDVAVVDQS